MSTPTCVHGHTCEGHESYASDSDYTTCADDLEVSEQIEAKLLLWFRRCGITQVEFFTKDAPVTQTAAPSRVHALEFTRSLFELVFVDLLCMKLAVRFAMTDDECFAADSPFAQPKAGSVAVHVQIPLLANFDAQLSEFAVRSRYDPDCRLFNQRAHFVQSHPYSVDLLAALDAMRQCRLERRNGHLGPHHVETANT